MVAAAASVLFALAGSSAAHAAATVTVTGDDGNPVGIAPGAGPAIRNMSPSVGIGFPSSDGRFSATFVGPDNTTVVGSAYDCFYYDNWKRALDYRGNGTYTIRITNYAKADTSCKTPTSTETYTFSINATMGVTPPPGPFLRRNYNSYTTNTLSLPATLIPGASTYDVQYAAGAVLAPDGSISNAPQTAFINRATGTIDLTFSQPGTYTVVARAKVGDYGTAWSAPVTVQVLVPFDLSLFSLPDPVGPSYLVRGTLRETSLRGSVRLAMARRDSKKRYRTYKSLGTVKISSKGTFSKRFTQRRSGSYRIRIVYPGSAVAPKTVLYQNVRITTRTIFR